MDMLKSIPGVNPLIDAPDISNAKTAEQWSSENRRIMTGAKAVGQTCDGHATALFSIEQTVPLQIYRRGRSQRYYPDDDGGYGHWGDNF